MRLERLQLSIAPGEGIAARFGDVVVFCPWARAGDPVVDRVLATCRSLAEMPGVPGDVLVERLAGDVGRSVPGPALCVLAAITGGLEVVLQGDVEVTIRRDGQVDRHPGSDPGSWVDLVVDDGFDELTVAAVGAVPPAGDMAFDLRDGVVPAGGLRLGLRLAPDEALAALDVEPEETGPAGEAGWEGLVRAVLEGGPDELVGDAPTGPGPIDGIEAVPLVGPSPVATSPPLAVGRAARPAHGPRVAALRCGAGHVSPPSALWCVVCGRSLTGPSVMRVEAARPPLGLLVVDDGGVYSLDGGYLVGSAPDDAPEVAAGTARPLHLDDPDGLIAPVHVEVRLAGWEVVVVDRGSPTGTFVHPVGADDWRRLEPDLAEPLVAGTTVAVGRRTVSFVGRPVRRPGDA